ncbi:MAG: glycosyltransferase family 2 protein [Giesbergeria sp.]|uniref:glycosyltransferase family 2 protein n=1 Tax=Giesbergeria sp. TaxID=2818473 RepID=UPI002610C662|nr:glycosyltransferase family 2 protein [Giesbergeria sp.]MDD2608376.1 glycosyltransferase family 2 protein [Giesbergeria sp.]
MILSLIIPAYNEAIGIKNAVQKIISECENQEMEIECWVIDDGSADNTLAEIIAMAHEDNRIHPLALTRNFGKEAAILAGLEAAQGDAVIVLDADLQHPPSLIPEMIQCWKKGFFVVEAVKQERGKESLSQKLFAKIFYGVFDRFGNVNLRGSSDFKLLDKKVITSLLAMPERHRFFRGLVSWAAYPTARLPFDVAPRESGQSGWNTWKLAKYAIDNLTGFSRLPLRLATLIGVSSAALAFVVIIISLIQKISGVALGGFTTVNFLIVIFGTAILAVLGIIAHYLGYLYEEVKGRPIYLLRPLGRITKNSNNKENLENNHE